MSKSTEEYKWQIVDRVKETPDTYTYKFTPVSTSQGFEFTIGEFITMSVLLMRPTVSGKLEESMVQRTYSIASSPTRDLIELTIKDEKPYGYINPVTKKADGFAAYFFEQLKIGDKISIRLNPNKNHFLWKIAAGMEKNIAYWSGANGAESARCLIQYMEDTGDTDINLTLFYSNPTLYTVSMQDAKPSLNVIYYEWLVKMAKKILESSSHLLGRKSQDYHLLSTRIILVLYIELEGSSQVLMEHQKELSQSTTMETLKSLLIRYVGAVVLLMGLRGYLVGR
jgi:ferredoxin-NADP reductase